MAFNLLDHDPSCLSLSLFQSLSCQGLSCSCMLTDKVQCCDLVGQVFGVLWRHLAILESTIPASSNSRSKAEVFVSRLNHWLNSKMLAMRPQLWMVSAA